MGEAAYIADVEASLSTLEEEAERASNVEVGRVMVVRCTETWKPSQVREMVPA